MESRRRHRAPTEPSPVGAVAGWGSFALVVACVVLVVVDPGAWRTLLWLAPLGALVVAVATATAWALPQRAMPPEPPPTDGREPHDLQ